MVGKPQDRDSGWDIIIKPKTGWFDLDIIDTWRYRDLIIMFVKRDFVTYYKQTILGPLWYVIQPLTTTLVFTVIFGKIAKISTDSVPPFLFYMAGNIMWNYFSSCLQKTSDTFNTNAQIFGKVYFPRLTVPVSVVIINLLQFVIQFVVFVGFYTYYIGNGSSFRPTIWLVVIPLLLFQTAILGLGTGILISSLTTKYRDLRFAMAFIIQLWMFATPIVYPLSQVPIWARPYYALNPMVSVVECFREIFFDVSSIHISEIGTSLIITVIFSLLGIIFFSRVERTFMDNI